MAKPGKKHFSPRDQDDDLPVPPHWEPEDDAAEHTWQSLASLLKEADEPRRLPSEADYSAVRERALEAWREGLRTQPAAEPTRREDSFLQWLRHALLGGGAGGQAFRLACAGAAAFALGWSLRPGAPIPAGATRPTEEPQTVASRIAPPPGTPNLPPATNRALHRSLQDQEGAVLAANAPDAEDVITWEPSALSPHDQGEWVYLPVSQAPLFALSAASSSPAAVTAHQGSAPHRAMEALQQLKFVVLTRRDHEAQDLVRALEESLRPVLEDNAALPRAEALALEAFRRGEEQASRGRTAEALLSFGETRALLPGTFLAFLAQFQIARLEFEELRDYEAALQAYRVALEEYPAHFLTDSHKDVILERVELLSRGAADGNWADLDLYQDARAASTPEGRAAKLRELLRTAPVSPLAVQAARQLADRVVLDPSTPLQDAQELLALIDGALDTLPDGPQAAELHFIKAEVLRGRMLDRYAALREYRITLDLPAPDTIRDQARARLQTMVP